MDLHKHVGLIAGAVVELSRPEFQIFMTFTGDSNILNLEVYSGGFMPEKEPTIAMTIYLEDNAGAEGELIAAYHTMYDAYYDLQDECMLEYYANLMND